MLEIDCKDYEHFEWLKENKNDYEDGIYDFTFEDRFIIYHANYKKTIEYFAYDKKTGYTSTINNMMTNKIYTEDEFKDMIPKILYSIKYTGDNRYITMFNSDPIEIIDTIFKTILPKYGYTIREEQIELSKTMYRGFTEKQVSICEAEVGTGKTLAYLIAAFAAKMYYEVNYNLVKPITISTATIELQQHLVNKEIPNLSKILLDYKFIKRPFITILRKGKEHYLCMRRLNELQKDLISNNSDKDNMIASIEMLKKMPLGFDLDNYYINTYLKNKVCVKDGCEGCKMQAECKYAKMVNTLYNSPIVDFQVTNHNLYLMSQKNKKGAGKMALLNSDFVVFDEAHKLKDVAQDVFSEEINEKDISKYTTNVYTLCSRKAKEKEYKEWILELNEENKKFFNEIKQMGVFEDETNEDHIILKMPETMIVRAEKMIELISKIDTHKTKKRNSVFCKSDNIVKALKKVTEFDKNVVWLETDENDVVSLSCSPINIDSLLNKKVWNTDTSFVLTSGTMSDGVDFEFFKSSLGINYVSRRFVGESSTASPFDYKRNARVYISTEMPQPDDGSEKYINAISEEILKLIKATNGHTAILFTSYKILSLVHEKIADELTQYDVITMTRGDKKAITDFKKSRNGILFASGSMWEGVDCVGDCLSSVIIVKLPFPIRNVVSNSKKAVCSETKEFIFQYCLPDMLIKLRQGMGRLIRSESDTGVISILDSRAVRRSYSSNIETVVEKYGRVQSIKEIGEFFSKVKNKEYFKT